MVAPCYTASVCTTWGTRLLCRTCLSRARARVKVGPTGIVPVPSATYRNNNYYKKICPPLTAECFCLSRTNMLVGRCSSLALALTASALFLKSGIVAGQPLSDGRAFGARSDGELLLVMVPMHLMVFLGCSAGSVRFSGPAVKSVGRANATATIEVSARDPNAFSIRRCPICQDTHKLGANFSGFVRAERSGVCGNLWQFDGEDGAARGQSPNVTLGEGPQDLAISLFAAPLFDKILGLPGALALRGKAWASMAKAIFETPLFRNNATATEEASVNERFRKGCYYCPRDATRVTVLW